MKRSLSKALVGLMSAGLVAGMALPGLAVGASDPTPTTIEPILVKSDAQVGMSQFRTSSLGGGNITSFDISPGTVGAGPSAGAPGLIATISTKDPLMRCDHVAGNCTFGQEPPYGGVEVMVLFQTPEMGIQTNLGCADAACTGQSAWVSKHPDDRFYWFVYYGASASELKEDWGIGYYDPTGRLVGLPLEPGIGQVFVTLAQAKDSICGDGTPNAITNPPGFLPAGVGHNIGVSFPGAHTVQLHVPYDLKYRANGTSTNPCAARTKRIAKSGLPLPATTGFPVIGLNSPGMAANTLRNAVAFSWMLHEIGGPDPIGLILGWTWYYDSVPALQSSGGYRVGTPAGDPNPSNLAGATCPANLRGVGPIPPQNHNPLFNGSPCMRANPVGPGFSPSGINAAL